MERLHLTVPRRMKEQLDTMAKKKGLTRSDLMRRIVDQHFETKRGEDTNK